MRKPAKECLPSIMRGGEASAWSQNDTQDMATIIMEGR